MTGKARQNNRSFYRGSRRRYVTDTADGPRSKPGVGGGGKDVKQGIPRRQADKDLAALQPY